MGTPLPPPTGSTPPHVRPATAADAPVIAEIQRAAWAERHALTAPGALPDAHDAESAWREAIAVANEGTPHLVLVAIDAGHVVGYLASTEATDPDAAPDEVEITDIGVRSDAAGEGHGSRLLAAWHDFARDAGATGAVAWVAVHDEHLRGLLQATGFTPDGARARLDLDGSGEVTVLFARLACALD